LGQKTNPIGFRLGINRTWNSKWFSEKDYAKLLDEDLMIKNYVHNRLEKAGVSRVEIERAPKKITLMIHTVKPGIVIGRKGADVDLLRDELQHLTKKEIYIYIQEIKFPELDAQIVAKGIAKQLEQRVSFRRVMKRAITAAMKLGAVGIKISCAGRLGGAEMARTEHYHKGRVPLHTLRAEVDYARATAYTTYGCVGVKVWICKKDES
jgi:small subunit ribosomal protein S3